MKLSASRTVNGGRAHPRPASADAVLMIELLAIMLCFLIVLFGVSFIVLPLGYGLSPILMFAPAIACRRLSARIVRCNQEIPAAGETTAPDGNR
jgi:hypothetical protein